jgi:iron complex outermembrane receptor protein
MTMYAADQTTVQYTSPPRGNVTRANTAAYVSTRWTPLPDRLHLIGNLRWDRFSDFDQQPWSPRFGLIVQPTTTSAIKLLWSTGFRVPTINEVATAKFQSSAIEPETTRSWEALYLLRTTHARVQLGLFRNETKDGIAWMLDPAIGNARLGNNMHYVVEGVESEAEADFGRWGADAAATWTRSRSKDPDTTQHGFPTWKLSGGVSWLVPGIEARLHLGSVVMLNMDEGDARVDLGVTDPQPLPHYWTMDLSLSKRWDTWHADLAVQNLLDRQNYLPDVYIHENGLPQPGLNFLGRVGVEF